MKISHKGKIYTVPEFVDLYEDLEQKLEKTTTLADDLCEIFGEMNSELSNWDPKAGEEYERRFNEVKK